MSQKIYIAVNKENKPLMFVSEPTRTETTWTGDFYVNSVIYEQVCEMVKMAGMTHASEPEVIEFQMK